jgi:hypothetical protein
LALLFLTESLHHNQPTTTNGTTSEYPSKKGSNPPPKTPREWWGKQDGRIESYLEAAPLNLALDFISESAAQNPAKPKNNQ